MWSEISTRPPRSSARLMPPAALVKTMERTPSGAQHAHAERHLRRRVAFVQVRAPGHHRDVQIAQFAEDQLAGVADRGGSRPAGNLGVRDVRRGRSSSSANAPRPLPSTTPTPGRSGRAALDESSGFGRSQQHSRDAGRHEVGHGAGGHRPQSQPRQVRFAVGRQRADAADLDGDRAEVGEAAQRVGGDGERARIERAPSSAPVA